MKVNGRFWIEHEGHTLVGPGRVALLEHIRDTGSISEAAKAMKMAYKAAWDAVDAMNSATQQQVVTRNTGGKHGGGTVLTPYGVALIETYRQMENAHRIFMNELCARYPLTAAISSEEHVAACINN